MCALLYPNLVLLWQRLEQSQRWVLDPISQLFTHLFKFSKVIHIHFAMGCLMYSLTPWFTESIALVIGVPDSSIHDVAFPLLLFLLSPNESLLEFHLKKMLLVG